MPDAELRPCFHFSACRHHATVEKGGKCLCRSCADVVAGREYPLRQPTREPLYKDDSEVSESLGLPVARKQSILKHLIAVV